MPRFTSVKAHVYVHRYPTTPRTELRDLSMHEPNGTLFSILCVNEVILSIVFLPLNRYRNKAWAPMPRSVLAPAGAEHRRDPNAESPCPNDTTERTEANVRHVHPARYSRPALSEFGLWPACQRQSSTGRTSTLRAEKALGATGAAGSRRVTPEVREPDEGRKEHAPLPTQESTTPFSPSVAFRGKGKRELYPSHGTLAANHCSARPPVDLIPCRFGPSRWLGEDRTAS